MVSLINVYFALYIRIIRLQLVQVNLSCSRLDKLLVSDEAKCVKGIIQVFHHHFFLSFYGARVISEVEGHLLRSSEKELVVLLIADEVIWLNHIFEVAFVLEQLEDEVPNYQVERLFTHFAFISAKEEFWSVIKADSLLIEATNSLPHYFKLGGRHVLGILLCCFQYLIPFQELYRCTWSDLSINCCDWVGVCSGLGVYKHSIVEEQVVDEVLI